MTQAVQPYAMPPVPNQFYGTQQRVQLNPGGDRQAQLLEAGPNSLLWRVSAAATNGQFRLTWGTSANNTLTGLLSPLVVSLPGAFNLQIVAVDPDVVCHGMAALSVSSGGLPVCRSLAGVGVLSPYAARVQALAATTVSVGGTAVVLAAGDRLDVGAPAVVTVGGPVVVEYAI